jgi:ABC-2 type transport system ATP-binding protein
VMFGQRVQLWWDLPLVDSLELLRHMYRVPADRYRDTLASLREALDLDPFMRTPVRQLSLGQRIRGELAAAMLHDPEILFLDEPTIGLDVVAKQRVREFLLRANRERGVTVMLTTHDLADIERLCSRILIIDHGRLIYDGEVNALKERYGTERVLVVDLEEPQAPLQVEGGRVIKVEGPRQWIAFERARTSARAARRRGRDAGKPTRPDGGGAGDRRCRAADLSRDPRRLIPLRLEDHQQGAQDH